MRSAAIFILLLSYSCKNATKLPVTDFLYNAYFKAKLDEPFQRTLEHYIIQPQLKLIEPENGYTLYPPLSALVDTTGKYVFVFQDHPNIQTLNSRGQLILHRIEGVPAEPELSYLFKSYK